MEKEGVKETVEVVTAQVEGVRVGGGVRVRAEAATAWEEVAKEKEAAEKGRAGVVMERVGAERGGGDGDGGGGEGYGEDGDGGGGHGEGGGGDGDGGKGRW